MLLVDFIELIFTNCQGILLRCGHIDRWKSIMNMMMLAELQIHLELLHPIKSCSIVEFKCNGLLYREYIVVYMCFGRGIGMATGRFGLGFAVTMPKPKYLSHTQLQTDTRRVWFLVPHNQTLRGSVFTRTAQNP